MPWITLGNLVNIVDVYNIYKTKMGYAIFKSYLVISNPNVWIMRVVGIVSRASTERLHLINSFSNIHSHVACLKGHIVVTSISGAHAIIATGNVNDKLI